MQAVMAEIEKADNATFVARTESSADRADFSSMKCICFWRAKATVASMLRTF